MGTICPTGNTSFANYINDGYVIDDFADIHRKEIGIEIDGLAGSFAPDKLAISRIRGSISYWHGSLEQHLPLTNVDLPALIKLTFC
jgi:hypothetical protein